MLPLPTGSTTPSNFSPPVCLFIHSSSAGSTGKFIGNNIFTSGFRTLTKRVFRSYCSMKEGGGSIGVKSEGSEKDDDFYMRRCVEIARRAIGCTSPNPMVGCVIVKDGKIVGEGFHPKAGQPHAEVFALRDAGHLAENATAYVSLEPCNHYGRTPPCTEALVNAKVKKVVVGMVDPNPIVASKGVNKLRESGISVTVGVEEELCKKLNEGYIHQMLKGRPFVTLRYSLSVNGCILNQLSEGVTKSGGYYSQLLQENDAIIQFSTSLTENFSFQLSKEMGAKQPLQILLAKNPTSPIQIPLSQTADHPKIVIFTDTETSINPEMAQMGVETVVVNRIQLDSILEYCKHQGFCNVLLDLREGFPEFEEIMKECIEKDLLQKVLIEVLPIWDGSEKERVPMELKSMGRTLRLRNIRPRISSNGVLLEGYF